MKTEVSRRIKELAKDRIGMRMEKVFSIPSESEGKHRNMQGGCSDGSFAYYAMVTAGPSETAESSIYKIRLGSWELVKVSGPIPMNHANDMVFDPGKHRLVVSHCDIFPERVSFVDPDSLKRIGTLDTPQKHYSLAFEADKGLYVAGKSRTYDLVLLDEGFRPVKELSGVPGYVKQGLECDEDLIYFFQTGPDLNWIFTFDWDGALVAKIEVPMVGESENLFVYGDGFVGAFNNKEEGTADIYVMTPFAV